MKKPSPHDKHTSRRSPPPTAPLDPDEVTITDTIDIAGVPIPGDRRDDGRPRNQSLPDDVAGLVPSKRQARIADTDRRVVSLEINRSDLAEVRAWLKGYAFINKLDSKVIASILRHLASEYETTTGANALTTPLPDAAPALWAQRDLNLRENAPQFIRRVYAAWLGRGLSRKQVKSLDPDLYRALSVWLTRHPDDEIASLLPRQSDLLDDLIDRLSADFSLEDLRKLGYAINARLRRASEQN